MQTELSRKVKQCGHALESKSCKINKIKTVYMTYNFSKTVTEYMTGDICQINKIALF